ncbi:MAG: ankyrin repeat domain-containing protein [Alphaproteobacteria bacterium]|nr:ankyrin repeat domain-containing protein [Alphaproteobacteria bacterium]
MSKLIGLCTIFTLIYGEAVFASTQLINAVESNDIKKVESLINDGADINYRDADKFTPLMHASRRGYKKIVDLLLKKKVKVDAVDAKNRTALMHAAMSPSGWNVIELLLNNKSDPNNQDIDGKTALIHAVEQGNLKAVEKLSSLSLLKTMFGKTNKANRDLRDNKGWTALMYAVYLGRKDIANRLLWDGADADKVNEQDQTALEIAVDQERNAFVQLLLSQRYWAKANRQNKQGQTVLMKAVEKESTDVVKTLITKKYYKEGTGNNSHLVLDRDRTADPNIEDLNRKTALMIAVEKGNLKIVTELVKSGADPDIQDKNRKTILRLAVEKGNLEIIKELVNYSKNLNCKDYNGQTALMLAVSKGNVNLVNLLIEKGADVNARDNNDKTALMFAASSGKEDIVRSLLEKKKKKSAIKKMVSKITRKKEEGIDINAKDKDGKTALDYAKEAGHTEVVEMLKVAAEVKKKK